MSSRPVVVAALLVHAACTPQKANTDSASGGADTGSADSGSGDSGGGDGGDGGDSGDGGTDAYVGCSDGSGWTEGGAIVEVGTMSAYLYVPADLPACAPLLLFAHGGSNAGSFIDGRWTDFLGTGLVEGADFRGYVLLVPGVGESKNEEHQWALSMTTDLNALVEEAWANLDLDRDQTWMIGQSAGGHMTTWQALTDPAHFSGVGIVSAGIGGYFDYPEVEPDPKLPVFVAHDPDDAVVPYSYSEQLAADLDEHGHQYRFEDWDLGEGGHGWTPDVGFTIIDWLANPDRLSD
jgi:predicted esterase